MSPFLRFHLIIIPVLLAFIALAGKPAYAQDNDNDNGTAVTNPVIPYAIPTDFDSTITQLKRCSQIIDNILRIQCYDRISDDLGATPKKDAQQKEQQLAKFGFWRATAKTNSVGEQLTNMRLSSNKPYLGPSGVQRFPELVLSCKTQHTDAYIDWKGLLVSNGTKKGQFKFIYSLDNAPGIVADWDLSFDNFAMFAPHALDFIRQLHGHKVMVMQLKPSENETATLTFTLAGLDNVEKIMYDRCYKSQQ